MAEDPTRQDGPSTESPPAPAPERPKTRSSIFDDKVVRKMAFAATGILILFLITVVSALITGVLQPGGPRTLAEREMVVTGRAIEAGTATPQVWAQHITRLVTAGQYGRARSALADARQSVSDSATADISLAEIRLLRAEGQYDRALAVADEGMEQIESYRQGVIAGGGPAGREAELTGRHDNYYILNLLKAEIYSDMEDWENALRYYDLFIEGFQGASDVLAERGRIKLRLGDESGAEADFREALRFDPYYPGALEGLERIGATP